MRAKDRQGVGVIRRRVEGIGEHLLPRLQALGSTEIDIGEKMHSGTRDPQFRDKAAIPKRIFRVVKKVDDLIQQFCWEVWSRHRGFRLKAKASALALGLLLSLLPSPKLPVWCFQRI
jgi:hypothetical protein